MKKAKSSKYMRIVLDDELIFLKSLNGVGVVFNEVFKQIFEELSRSGDSIRLWNSLVQGRIGIEIKLTMNSDLLNNDSSKKESKQNSKKKKVIENVEDHKDPLSEIFERIKDFDLGG